MLNHLVAKDKLSLLVTDSGLGGLAICADMVRNLVDQRLFKDLSVVYFNAWPMEDKGYNLLDGDAERFRIFGNALRAMQQFEPDCIFIACNTLSIIYLQGELAANVSVPVVNIINFGVDMIAEQLKAYPESAVLILGTQTTVSTGLHKALLVDQGITESRILQQNCHGLAGAIEQDPGGSNVEALVDQFLAEAAGKIQNGPQHIFAALCCTHYAYIQDLIRERLARFTGATVDIINPNQGMSDSVVVDRIHKRFTSTNLKTKVVSRVALKQKNIDFITSRIKNVSSQMAQALQSYARMPNLFDV